MANVSLFISVYPNFQFVLSVAIELGDSSGKSVNINVVIKSLTGEYSAIKPCIRLCGEFLSKLFSKSQANFSKETTCILYSTQINKLIHPIRALFKLLPKC